MLHDERVQVGRRLPRVPPRQRARRRQEVAEEALAGECHVGEQCLARLDLRLALLLAARPVSTDLGRVDVKGGRDLAPGNVHRPEGLFYWERHNELRLNLAGFF